MNQSTKSDGLRTLLFIDILGFAALTEANPSAVARCDPDARGRVEVGPSLLQKQMLKFQAVLEGLFSDEAIKAQAMLFSDCAYLVTAEASAAALVAADLMRAFILERVPVRMGIGKGTFHGFELSLSLSPSKESVSRCLFAGTGVVLAHAAEQCGGKGLRIFVHRSVEADLSKTRNVRLVRLKERFLNARWELNYLPQRGIVQRSSSVEAGVQDLMDAVSEMKKAAKSAPARIRRHYVHTLKSLGRMRAQREPKSRT